MIEIKDGSQLEFAKRLQQKLVDEFTELTSVDRSHKDYPYRHAQADAFSFLHDELNAAIAAFEKGVEFAKDVLKHNEQLRDFIDLSRLGGSDD